MRTLPLTEARKDLPKIVDEVSSVHEHVVITKHGKPEAVVLSAEEYESWQETLDLLGDREAMKGIREGLRDIKAGRVKPLDEVLKRLHL